MSVINSIKYQVYNGQESPEYKPGVPVILIAPDDEAYGDITIQIREIILDVEPKVYLVEEPTTAEDRWIKTGNDLYSPTLLFWSVTGLSSTATVITWRFCPAVIAAENGSSYVIEFGFNIGSVIIVPAKIVIKMKERIGD